MPRVYPFEPCPFCGSKEGLHVANLLNKHFIECNTCLATGPIGATPEGAAKLWNKSNKEVDNA